MNLKSQTVVSGHRYRVLLYQLVQLSHRPNQIISKSVNQTNFHQIHLKKRQEQLLISLFSSRLLKKKKTNKILDFWKLLLWYKNKMSLLQ
jgi:hypothetical protein